MNIRALLGISGILEHTDDCAEAPKEVRHVHGLADNVLSFRYGPDGDETYPVQLWRDKMACADSHSAPSDWSAVDFLTLTRKEWDCADGTRVHMDTHPGGHFIPHGWLARHLDELLGRTPVFP